MSLGFFGTVVVVGSVFLGDTAPLTVPKCEPPPSGFFWRSEDAPQVLKQSVDVCWSFVGGVTAISSAVTVQPLVFPLVDQPPRVDLSNTLFDEVPAPVTSPNDR